MELLFILAFGVCYSIAIEVFCNYYYGEPRSGEERETKKHHDNIPNHTG